MEFLANSLSLLFHVLEAFGPWLAAIATGAFLEAKFGQKALAAARNELLAVKTELAALKAKL